MYKAKAESPIEHCTPNWLNLAELWMEKHYEGRVAAVFFHPLEHMALMQKHFSDPHTLSSIIHCEFAVLEIGKNTSKVHTAKAMAICDATPQELFTMVWDGTRFVHENT